MNIVAWLSQSFVVKNRKKGNTYDKIDNLLKYWVNEFFIWYVPDYWFQKFWFEISPNWRQSFQAQVTSLEEFTDLCRYIKSKWWKVLMTLNANSYNKSVWSLVEKILDDSDKAWVDWVILSDLMVLNYLKEKWYSKRIHLSTIFNIYNKETINFFVENYNISRFILPREVTLKEIKSICEAFPNEKFEVFLSWDKCVWNNWSCFTEHNTHWGNEQFKDTVSWNPHSYCQFIEKVYSPKKSIDYDFKKILTDNTLDQTEVYSRIDNQSKGRLEDIWSDLLSSNNFTEKDLVRFYNFFKKKNILIYDNSLGKDSDYNKTIINFISWFKKVFSSIEISEKNREKLQEFIKYHEEKINFWIKFYLNRIKEYWLEYVKIIDTLEWNRNGVEAIDLFKTLPNIESLKVPARWKDIQHILDYISGDKPKEMYSKLNFLEYDWDNSTWKFNYYNSLLRDTI